VARRCATETVRLGVVDAGKALVMTRMVRVGLAEAPRAVAAVAACPRTRVWRGPRESAGERPARRRCCTTSR